MFFNKGFATRISAALHKRFLHMRAKTFSDLYVKQNQREGTRAKFDYNR